ncbi:hypothetical protein HIM_06853 [Hirsutella minnesotensis 3608]|uniref:Uncharacterized protein n=1 Tax=Hirsutella minnesotensis 3608 TaxID=1043627 RepID=A0A0F7ZNH0_9HYPO|nr:hypothetical protein HIM_06853 [Hirsutella minnesotensis 3608]
MAKYNKHWAQEYLLGPLTEPEPSQETGLGSSHVRTSYPTAQISPSRPPPSPASCASSASTESDAALEARFSASYYKWTSSPPPASPTSTPRSRRSHHSESSRHSKRNSNNSEVSSADAQNPFAAFVSAHSQNKNRNSAPLPMSSTLSRNSSMRAGPAPSRSASVASSKGRGHPISRSASVASSVTHREGMVSRSASVTSSVTCREGMVSRSASNASSASSRSRQPARSASVATSRAERERQRPQSLNTDGAGRAQNLSASASTRQAHRHTYTPGQRSPLGMSERPLDAIRAEARMADRRSRQCKRATYTDCIDRLDTIGSSYHHGGPYDAARPCNNLVEKYSPLAAVRESNMEAIRATPAENVIDSLQKSVPLQGTATIAAGATDMRGNVMEYSEGTNLTKEAEASGGASKRWAGVVSSAFTFPTHSVSPLHSGQKLIAIILQWFHPSDLESIGESSSSSKADDSEAEAKSKRRQKHESTPVAAIEMQSGVNRARPFTLMPDSVTSKDVFASGNLQRSVSTSKRLSEGIKRRFSSFRRKKDMPAAAVC